MISLHLSVFCHFFLIFVWAVRCYMCRWMWKPHVIVECLPLSPSTFIFKDDISHVLWAHWFFLDDWLMNLGATLAPLSLPSLPAPALGLQTSAHAKHFMWVLEMGTQVFIFMLSNLCGLSHFPSPPNQTVSIMKVMGVAWFSLRNPQGLVWRRFLGVIVEWTEETYAL